MSKEKASQRIDSKISSSDKKRKVSPLIFIIPTVLIIIVVGIVFVTLAGKESKANFVVTPDNVEEVIAKLEKEEITPIGQYEIKMTTEWHFDDALAISEDAYVENVVNNNCTVYFTLSLKDSAEDFYKSPYIPVGSSLKNIQLDTDLGKGSHEAVLKYHLLDESYKETSTVSVGVTIIIEK